MPSKKVAFIVTGSTLFVITAGLLCYYRNRIWTKRKPSKKCEKKATQKSQEAAKPSLQAEEDNKVPAKAHEKSETNSAREIKEKGNDHFKANNLEKAIECYDRAIEIDSENISCYVNRAICYIKMKQYEKALEDAEKTISLDDTKPKGYYLKGLCSLEMEKLGLARKCFQKAIELDPMNHAARLRFNECEQKIKTKTSAMKPEDFVKNLGSFLEKTGASPEGGKENEEGVISAEEDVIVKEKTAGDECKKEDEAKISIKKKMEPLGENPESSGVENTISEAKRVKLNIDPEGEGEAAKDKSKEDDKKEKEVKEETAKVERKNEEAAKGEGKNEAEKEEGAEGKDSYEDDLRKNLQNFESTFSINSKANIPEEIAPNSSSQEEIAEEEIQSSQDVSSSEEVD